jgi:hypothetical protein
VFYIPSSSSYILDIKAVDSKKAPMLDPYERKWPLQSTLSFLSVCEPWFRVSSTTVDTFEELI